MRCRRMRMLERAATSVRCSRGRARRPQWTPAEGAGDRGCGSWPFGGEEVVFEIGGNIRRSLDPNTGGGGVRFDPAHAEADGGLLTAFRGADAGDDGFGAG